jgi:hypothetical protein
MTTYQSPFPEGATAVADDSVWERRRKHEEHQAELAREQERIRSEREAKQREAQQHAQREWAERKRHLQHRLYEAHNGGTAEERERILHKLATDALVAEATAALADHELNQPR